MVSSSKDNDMIEIYNPESSLHIAILCSRADLLRSSRMCDSEWVTKNAV